MPLCPDADGTLTANAQTHIEAQRATLKRLDHRLNEMEGELKQGEPGSHRAKLLEKAIADLRLEVRGQKLNPNTGKYEQVKKPGAERVEVMESLYTERPPKLFTYKAADGTDRKATVYGMPTIQEMHDAGAKDAAHEMVVRSLSLLSTGDSSRNPYDYLNTEGLEVKNPLDRIIEHHHVFNNVVVKPDGTIHPMSIGIRSNKDGNLELSVIPAHHGYNYEQPKEGQMDSVQFICLMDAMHSGADAVAHLHYYKFDPETAEQLKAKAVEKSKEKAIEALIKLPRLEWELETLEARQKDPAGYEKQLTGKLTGLNKRLAQYEGKRLKKGSDEANARDSLKAEAKKVQGDLDKHNKVQILQAGLDKANAQIDEFKGKMKAIASPSTIANYRKKLKAGGTLTPEQKRKLQEYEALKERRESIGEERDKQKNLLDKEGTIESKIATKKKQILENQQLSELTENSVRKMFDDSNGFFSFDKGATEKQAHETFRPKMNEEITKTTAQDALEYLKRPDSPSLDELYRQEYQRNLVNRLSGLASKLL